MMAHIYNVQMHFILALAFIIAIIKKKAPKMKINWATTTRHITGYLSQPDTHVSVLSPRLVSKAGKLKQLSCVFYLTRIENTVNTMSDLSIWASSTELCHFISGTLSCFPKHVYLTAWNMMGLIIHFSVILQERFFKTWSTNLQSWGCS